MPRGPRREVAGGIHHVTTRAPAGRVLFRDDVDRHGFLRLLVTETVRRAWRLLTYCLMTNHTHLLVLTPEPDLGKGLQTVHQHHATSFNRRHTEHGALFGARFKNRVIEDDAYLLACLRYIARNPVEAGLCRRAGQWPWSAHATLAGWTDDGIVDRTGTWGLLDDLGSGSAQDRYLRLVSMSDSDLVHDLRASGDPGWLRRARDQFGLSTADLAVHLGVSPATVRRRLADDVQRAGRELGP